MQKGTWKRVGAVALILSLIEGAILLSQSQETTLRRAQLAAVQLVADDEKRVQAENERLRKEQISAAELEALREDHVAMLRLRAEVEALQTSVKQREQALATAAQPAGGTFRRPVEVALTLAIEIGGNGTPSLDGAPLDPAVVRQQLAAVGRGRLVHVKVKRSKAAGAAGAENFRRTMEVFEPLAKELGISLMGSTETVDP